MRWIGSRCYASSNRSFAWSFGQCRERWKARAVSCESHSTAAKSVGGIGKDHVRCGIGNTLRNPPRPLPRSRLRMPAPKGAIFRGLHAIVDASGDGGQSASGGRG